MQSKTLLERTGCSEPTFKDWLRRGVILPAQPGQGRGIHAKYDEANAAALVIGVRMKEVGIVVSNYVSAFVELQAWFRETSSFEWNRYAVAMTPESASVHLARRVINLADMALIVPLAPVCQVLSRSIEGNPQYQIFGLHVVKKTK